MPEPRHVRSSGGPARVVLMTKPKRWRHAFAVLRGRLRVIEIRCHSCGQRTFVACGEDAIDTALLAECDCVRSLRPA